MKINPGIIGVVIIAGLSVALVKSCLEASNLQSENDVLRSDNSLQGQVIATQAFNFNRFNQVAEHANRLNSLIDTSTEETVIEYREILRREKTCDLPVPADTADDRAVATSSMTYCQAVLWIKPLLAVIEKGNNNFAGIRQIELERKN